MLKKEILMPAILAAVMMVGTAAVLAADGHSHDHGHHHAGGGDLLLDNGARWETDEPLRRAMTAIRNEIAHLLPRIHPDELPASDYEALAMKVETNLQKIIDNCELTPEADAQFHTLLARMYMGVAAMKEGDGRRAGAVQIVRALDAYPGYFDHPGWEPLDH